VAHGARPDFYVRENKASLTVMQIVNGETVPD
jgi:hypothetical protein